MSKCPVCLDKDSAHPKEWERECTGCFNASIKGTDGTFTKQERLDEYRRRSKWTLK